MGGGGLVVPLGDRQIRNFLHFGSLIQSPE